MLLDEAAVATVTTGCSSRFGEAVAALRRALSGDCASSPSEVRCVCFGVAAREVPRLLLAARLD